MTRIEKLTAALQSLRPAVLEIEDESHRHAGHAGAASGHGHFRVKIVAACFDGMSLILRHRKVYEAVGELMKTDIHALAIEARASNE